MQGQLFCMHCISIVCMSNMRPLSRIVTPGQRKWKDYCVQVQCRCVPDASFGVCWVFSFADPWQHCLENPPLSLVQPLGAGLSPTLMQARQFCLTNTQKPPRVASYHHSEDLSQGCLSSWGRFFLLMSRLKSQCCRSNSLKQLFIKGRGQERRRAGERSENKQRSVLCRWP